MLTQRDLTAIGNLIDTKLEEKLESKLEEKLESKLEKKLESKFSVFEKKLYSKFEEKLGPIHSDIKSLKQDTQKLHTEIRHVLDFLDRGQIKLRIRVERIETHLALPHAI